MSDDIKLKLISFKREYHEEYDFLLKQGNASRLVCELVRQYRLSGGEIAATTIPTTISQVVKESKYDDDILDSAKGLLD